MLKLLLTTGVFVLSWWLLALPARAGVAPTAPAPPYKEGVNYIPVVPSQPVNVNPGHIEVLDFFWYGSTQCFELEPYLDSWAANKPANVILTRVPAALNPHWDLAARAYYTAVQLGVADKANSAIYAALNSQHRSLSSMNDYQNLFTTELSVSAPQFAAAWNSLAVDTALEHAKVLAQRYSVTVVPSLTVNGEWLTGTGYKLTTPEIMNAVNWLVQRELAVLPPGTP